MFQITILHNSPPVIFKHSITVSMSKEISDSFKGLNFSGDESSWFDLWHAHSSCEDVDALDWNKRAACLQELIELYHYFQKQLEKYPKHFRLWIEVWENDPTQNAVYIHTPNPNNQNFPIAVEDGFEPDIPDMMLKTWIEKQPFEKLTSKMQDDTVVYLFDPNVGITLKP